MNPYASAPRIAQIDEEEPRSGGNRGMTFVLVVIFLVAAAFIARELGIPGKAHAGAWVEDWETGLSTSEKTGKPMLVLFTADWCPPCRELKSDVLPARAVAEQLDEFTLVRVDLTERGGPNSSTAQTYGVRGIPTLILFDSRGKQVDRISGCPDSDRLADWLKTRGAKARGGR